MTRADWRSIIKAAQVQGQGAGWIGDTEGSHFFRQRSLDTFGRVVPALPLNVQEEGYEHALVLPEHRITVIWSLSYLEEKGDGPPPQVFLLVEGTWRPLKEEEYELIWFLVDV